MPDECRILRIPPMNPEPQATKPPLVVCSDERPPSVLWIWLATAAFSALIVPYATNFIQWANANGYFPIRPAIYGVIASLGCLAVTFGRRSDLTVTALLVIFFHLAYMFISLLPDRYVHPSGRLYPLMTHGALLLSTFSITWFLGVTQRLTVLPILVSFAAVVVIGSLSNFADWFGVHQFSKVIGRAAGFHGDPNNSCIAIVLALAVFLTLNRKLWLSFAMIALSFIAVAITLSRSGLIAEILISATFLGVTFRKRPAAVLKALAVTVPVVIVGIGYLVSNMSSQTLRQSDIQDRLGALMGKDSEKMASGERMKDVQDGLDAVRDKPIFGYGVGAGTGKWQPHNQLVAIWIDGGILFGGIYLLILGLIALKCLATGGQGLLCLLAVIIFIPFSQILHTSLTYWATCIILINLTSTRFITLQWAKPRQIDRPCDETSNPSNFPEHA